MGSKFLGISPRNVRIYLSEREECNSTLTASKLVKVQFETKDDDMAYSRLAEKPNHESKPKSDLLEDVKVPSDFVKTEIKSEVMDYQEDSYQPDYGDDLEEELLAKKK